jgi:hypothetical protein
MKIAIFTVMALMANPARAETLHLLCGGQGIDTRADATTANAYSSNGNFASATAIQRRATGFSDEMEVQISDGVGQARLPRSIIPKIHGGHDGWFEIKNLAVSDSEITGKVAMNFTNAPRMHISRITGSISIDGHDGSFSGQCRAYDPATVHRAF